MAAYESQKKSHTTSHMAIEKALAQERYFLDYTGGRGGIRTHDLRLRRPTLYPAELPAHWGFTTFVIRLCNAMCNNDLTSKHPIYQILSLISSPFLFEIDAKR